MSRRDVPGRMAAARGPERAALMLGRVAAGATGGGSSEFLIFEHGGELYRALPHPDTDERVWARWPSGEAVACPFGEVE
ncbi:hypothetical protein AB0M39_38315 [Streptomyces sp. NPDC051907]|uniref:hypothetical protein n=1 Tax=Streptomyces sp. NPDC051907 TaxID=3155284 RepID=UPI00344446CA